MPVPLILFAAGLGCSSCSTSKGHEAPVGGAPRDTSAVTGDPDSAADSAPDSAADSAPETGGDSTADTAAAPCPAVPSDALTVTLPDGYGHPTAVLLASGQVGVYALPTLSDGYDSEQLTFGESAGGAYSPQPVAIELTISRCPGEILAYDASDFCTYYTTNGAYNSIVYLGHAHEPMVDAASANLYGLCWAPEDEGPWYLNMRWTYTTCAYGATTCGFMLQRNLGAW